MVELFWCVWDVVFGHDPICGALIQGELFDFGCYLRHKLNGTRGNANDTDAFALQVMAVIPTSGVECGALKFIHSRDRRPDEIVEHAESTHHDMGFEFISRFGDNVPARVLCLPAG